MDAPSSLVNIHVGWSEGQKERKGRYGRRGTNKREGCCGKMQLRMPEMDNINELQQRRSIATTLWTDWVRGLIKDRATTWCGPKPKPLVLKLWFVILKTATWKRSLTCLLLGCRGIRSSLSAVWCRKWGSSTLILLMSPNQIWGGGFQKPFLTWNARINIEKDKTRDVVKLKGTKGQKESQRLLFLVGTLSSFTQTEMQLNLWLPHVWRQLNRCAN